MIEILEGFSDNILAVAARGRVTKKDYDDILTPALTEALRRHKRIRCYYELGRQYSGVDVGAAVEDFRLGVEHRSRFERVAVVTDVGWIRMAMKIFRFLVPGEVRLFGTSQASDAQTWIAAT